MEEQIPSPEDEGVRGERLPVWDGAYLSEVVTGTPLRLLPQKEFILPL